MRLWEIEFADFCKGMWLKNCVERHDWKQDPYEYDKYVEDNLEFLKAKHAESRLERLRNEESWME
jgi:hypothetical protein